MGSPVIALGISGDFTISFKLQVYKIKVERPGGHWGVELIPNWYLYRRYNDFVKFNDELFNEFPNITDLNLPPKKWLGNNFDPVFIGKRIIGLTKYLRTALTQTEIQNCQATRKFLCLDKPPHRATSISSNRVSKLTRKYVNCNFEVAR